MMLRIAANEFRYLFRSPQTLVSFAVFFMLTYFAMVSSNVTIGAGGNVHVNSPFALAQTFLIMNVFAIFAVPAFLANAILKDVDHKFDGILFTTPITKADYLFGRFLGAFGALVVALMGIPLGSLIGTFMPWVDPETLAPTNLGHYIYIYFGLVLPSVLALSAIIYSVAVMSRSLMFSYLAIMAMLILYLVSFRLLSPAEYGEITALIDPLMVRTISFYTQYWTAVERNTNLVGYEGVVLTNRLIWIGVSLFFIALSYKLFSFRAAAKMPKEKKSKNDVKEAERAASIRLDVRGTPVWGFATDVKQFLLRTRFEVASVFKGLPFIIIMMFSFFLMIMALINRSVGYGLDAYPVTRLMVEEIQEGLALGIIVLLVFYSSEIIWRERTAKVNEIIDAMPTANWVFVVSKILAMAAVVTAIIGFGIVVSIAVQLASGYDSLEISMYLHRGLFHFAIGPIMIAVLCCFVQVLVKNRFLGMLIMVVYIISTIILSQFGFEHPLYQFGEGIDTPLSDMNGSGRYIEGDYWLRGYWASFSILLMLLTYMLWNRGTLQPLQYRLKGLRQFKRPVIAGAAVFAFIAFVGTGAYVYYNTNVLNDYVTADDREERAVAYEKKYRQYEDLPMPRTVDIKIDVDIYPYKRRVETRSTQIVENKTGEPIHSVHLVFPATAEKPVLEFEGATEASYDDVFNYFILDLAEPMMPGDRRSMTFETLIQHKGFAHSGNSVALVRNGTFLNNFDLTPYIGFAPQGMLADRNTRREYDLEPLPRTAKLEDVSQHGNNYIRQDSDFVTFETTVSTIKGQTVVAPGYLQDEWVEGDRHYFRYEMDAPIMNFYSYLSAEYDVVRDHFEGVDIEVYHHAPHTYNVERMIASVKDSIAYFSKAFSPYQHRQLRILEFPAYRQFAQAFPNTVPYSEAIGFITEINDDSAIDLPYYVTAHEVAHQWWAHQVMSANTQGGTMLVETLAQYSALLVMEQKYGKDQIRKFLKYELDRYLRGRATDPEGETPLYRVENQSYIHYRKGSVIMYALKDYLGEEVVNRSLQRLIELRAFRSDPYAISTDLLTILREEAPAHQHSIIEDFFEKITIFDVKIDESRVTETADGRYKVELDVEVAKIYADAEGNETEAVFDIPVDIGLFLKSPAEEDFGTGDVLMLEKHSVSEPKSTIEFIVDKMPAFAGIDPYNKLIDRNSNDNLAAVEQVQSTASGR